MNERRDPSENDRLRQSWECRDAKILDAYLVSGVEDPRINVQSILTRALLADAIFPGHFTTLIEEELQFGCEITRFLASLGPSPIPLDTFQKRWRRELECLSHDEISIFEPACGSANDFRFLDAYGFARFLRYTGIDIAPKNIANARRRFPDVDFRVGDLMENGLADNEFDYSFVHDLFEHLSFDGMQRAVKELLRVTRREAWLHFFNAANASSHQVRQIDAYHWNTLSIGRMIALVERSGFRVEVISIAELARTKFGLDDYYNPGAYTIIASR